jgi:selenocysteine-specific elongation factor
VAAFQQKNPLVRGISREELRGKLGVGTEVLNAAIDRLVEEGRMEASGEQVRLPGRSVVMKVEEAESKAVIENAFALAGLKAPGLKEVLAGLKIDQARAQKIVTLLLRDKVLIKVSDELVFHRDALADLRKRMIAEKFKSAKIDVAQFKELTGVTRKYAIPLLEYLDRERVTRRVGNERVIL